MWCGEDGVWKDVWIPKKPPAAAKISVYKSGFKKPLTCVAKFDTYARRKKDGNLLQSWKQMPDLMLSKCAEALALRKAFPQDTSGLYTSEEMGSEVIEVKQNKPKVRSETVASHNQNSDFAPPSPENDLYTDVTNESVTMKDLKELNAVMKTTGWTSTEVAESADMLYGVISAKDLTMGQFSELIKIVSENNPEEGAKIILDLANARKVGV
jgi:hypothetical protein